MERAELIVCRDLSLGYEGQSVLSHFDLRIRSGDYLCIVGDNGSGKSTLLRGLLGLLPPLAGTIERAAELEEGAVGYLPHEPVTGLDPAAAQDLYKTLAYLNKKEGMAVVMVTHDLRPALREAGKVLHIGHSGTFLGTPAEYLASPYGRRFQEAAE